MNGDERRRPPMKPGGPEFQWKRALRTLAFWALFLVAAMAVAQLFGRSQTEEAQLTYPQYKKLLESGKIVKAVVIEEEFHGWLSEPILLPDPQTNEPRKFRRIVVNLGQVDKATIDEWLKYGLEFRFEKKKVNWTSLLLNILPWALFVGLWLAFFYQMQAGQRGIFSFGKSRARLVAEKPKVTFKDVAGADEAKQELQEIIDFLKNPEKFRRLGGRVPKGVLLVGPPGTGKTYIAKAVAGEAGVPFFSMSGSDFVEMFVGVGASVTGDTPILVRTPEGTRLVPIGEFVDSYYKGDEEGFVVPVEGVQTLGYEELDSKFKGSPKRFFGCSAWKDVRGVYRHRVDSIYEVHYLGGVLRATGDHSVFVRTRNGIQPKAVKDLRPGDVLVGLPTWKEDITLDQVKRPYVKEVVVKPYDGYVYDLCGCDNEAFFGGEKPVLLHNSRVRDLFRQAKAHAPCIIFIDEIDAVGRHRGAGLGGGHDEREQTLNQLLVEMDGFESSEGIIILAATNRPDILDPALLRPGRFDRQVVMDLPDVKGREGILKVHTRNIPLSRDVKLDVIAKGTPGLSGADLENLVNEAVLLASRKGRKRVRMEDFEEAKDKVMMGMARKMAISDEEKKLIAYHETGHALMAKLMPGGDPVHKVTIIPRGRALGVTHFLPMDERHTYSKSYCMAKLVYALGGRAAEKLVFGEVSTGAGGDYEQATELARKMVCEWGMSERLGPVVYGQREEEIFLGREITRRKDYSERTAELIDQEIKALIEEAERTAERLLKENEDKLHAVAQALLEYEVLDGEQIDRILRGEPLHKSKPGRTSSSKEPPVPTAASEG